MQITSLEDLIKMLAKLPGLGPRSARRIVLHLIKNPATKIIPLASKMYEVAEAIKDCQICGNVDLISPCSICSNHKRDQSIICVLETIADLWAIERSNSFNGKYHVLGGALSAIDGITPETLNIKPLYDRVEKGDIKEIIIATNPTLEGQSTSFYLIEFLEELTSSFDIKISRLPCGLPVGAELDYIDDGTMNIAFKRRENVD